MESCKACAEPLGVDLAVVSIVGAPLALVVVIVPGPAFGSF
ncbi:MAG TPA: hypothetical protein VJS30_18450 [Paraburkholderia sp.]|nr:hypothetical protein [Paraburkholderia sp.]